MASRREGDRRAGGKTGTEGSRREGVVREEVRIWDLVWAVRRGREGGGVVARRVVRRVGEGRGKEEFVRVVFSWVARVLSIVGGLVGVGRGCLGLGSLDLGD